MVEIKLYSFLLIVQGTITRCYELFIMKTLWQDKKNVISHYGCFHINRADIGVNGELKALQDVIIIQYYTMLCIRKHWRI